MAPLFSRLAIIGTGLVGGSFALAARAALKECVITGWDKPDVLARAKALSVIDEPHEALADALLGADLIYVALPVGLTIQCLPEISRHAPPRALVTDAASTKREVCAAARACFTGGARFLGGHPMAGSESSGVDAASAALFHGAKYALMREASGSVATAEPVGGDIEQRFVQLIEVIGARPMWMDPATHDRAAALVSHLPQLVAVALASVARESTDQSGLPLTLAGRGLRDALRLAGSPYGVWRDIVLTNTDNLESALDRVSQAIEYLRANLRQRELEQEFAAANDVYKILRDLQ